MHGAPATFPALARAYRTWALTHPHMHRLINDRPLNRTRLPVGLDDRAGAPLVAAYDGDRDTARAAWATIKGLVDLELADRFPPTPTSPPSTPRLPGPGARGRINQ
ncbi:TetR-like C-terminal domain-containing protein [Micromonospora taraxaci]|uniref:TetR-like C-terminal domain-containing protein n=1 Tax=Micromonospora taraxaci TaxID=1316803 RepID=UPI0033F9103A